MTQYGGNAVLWLALLLSALLTTEPARGATRIMPLGDSITQGDDNHNTYRRPLWQKLQAAKFDVDFVGTFNSQFGGGKPPNPDFDLDHQGEWGREAWAVLPKVQGYAEATKPDIVLLHLGTNDVRSGRSVQEAVATLGQIIDTLRGVNPSIKVLIASIIPTDDSTHNIIQALAAEIPRLALQKSTTQSPVVLVDQNAGFDAHTDTYDGVHPNPGGEEKLAQKWYAALYPILGGTPPSTTSVLLNAVVNAASSSGTQIAPGEIVTLYGSATGPATPASPRLNASGLVDTNIGETRVLFDGTPAPMIYTSAGQVSAIVPYSVAGKTAVTVQTEYRGAVSNPLTLAVGGSSPALFTADSTGKGQGAILNQDGSLNSAANPADRGSIVVLYATGEGSTNPGGTDGRIAREVLPKPVLPVRVLVAGQDAEVLYAGAAPGQVAGLMQLNVRVPTTVPSGGPAPVVVSIGGTASQSGVTVALRIQ